MPVSLTATILALPALLLGFFLMQTGNTFQGTILSIRGEIEGFTLAQIGAVGAGFWAGVISTIFYWIVLPIGVLIEALPRVQEIVNKARANGNALPSGEALKRAVEQSIPAIFATIPADQGWRSLFILLAIGLACAMGFAFLGGLFGLRSEGRRRA